MIIAITFATTNNIIQAHMMVQQWQLKGFCKDCIHFFARSLYSQRISFSSSSTHEMKGAP